MGLQRGPSLGTLSAVGLRINKASLEHLSANTNALGNPAFLKLELPVLQRGACALAVFRYRSQGLDWKPFSLSGL